MATQSDLTTRAGNDLATPTPRDSGAAWLSAGGILAGLATASCCVVPFLLFAAGVSGAWIADLTALEPYRFYFAGAAIVCIGLGFYRVYRRPPVACAAESYCAQPASRRIAKLGLWSAIVIVLIALLSPYVIVRWL